MAKAKMNADTLFERHEKKFMVPSDRYPLLMGALTPYMEPDQYGQYAISSVYFDTDDYALIRKSLDKPSFKQKLRLRSYGTPGRTDTVYMELKKKLDGVTYKRRLALPLWQARAYLEEGAMPPQSGLNAQTFGEIHWFIQQTKPVPKVLLSYDRLALCGKEDPDLRMTFDTDIRWRDHHLDLGMGDYGTSLLKPRTRLLEVKTAASLPLWLCGILSKLQLYPQSFSKYGMVYTEHLMYGKKEADRIAG